MISVYLDKHNRTSLNPKENYVKQPLVEGRGYKSSSLSVMSID